MPIPTRRKGTPKDEFIGKCIAKLKGEYPLKQAAAICYQQMRAQKKQTTKQSKYIYNQIN